MFIVFILYTAFLAIVFGLIGTVFDYLTRVRGDQDRFRNRGVQRRRTQGADASPSVVGADLSDVDYDDCEPTASLSGYFDYIRNLGSSDGGGGNTDHRQGGGDSDGSSGFFSGGDGGGGGGGGDGGGGG